MSDDHKCLAIALCVATILVCFFLIIWLINRDDRNLISEYIGNKSYKVLDDKPNKETAAMILQSIDNNIIKLIQHMNKKYTDEVLNKESPEKRKMLKTIIERLNSTYKSHNLKENYPKIPGKDVSFNVNKGEDISLCLRNYNQPHIFHQMNDIMFVSIHELAHSCNESYGHDDKFWKLFRILIENSLEIGIFKDVNYKREPVNYCSMAITYSPQHDESLNDVSYFNNDNIENFNNPV